LLGGIAPVAVSGPVKRLSGAYHVGGYAKAVCTPAIGDSTPIAVAGGLSAQGWPGQRQEGVQRVSRGLPASIFGAGPANAGLPGLRSVYAIEPNALAVDFERVAVDD